MKMKRMSASFGTLKDARLKLLPGLNIIQAPNETGKSTWTAFIRAMLYGINTSERNRDGVLAEKTKYRPWSGGAMEGIMELETEHGQDIAVQRAALGASPMKKLDVRYTDSGQEVTSLMHENLGEVLTGVPEAVFVRSAFIRQDDIKISQTGSLEQRIGALVSSGEEGVSYGDTVKLLGEWLRRRRHNKKGQIPAIEAEVAVLDRTLAQLQEVFATHNEISLDLDRAMLRTEELIQDQNTHFELERRSARQKIAIQRKKVQDLQWEIKSHRERLTRGGAQVSSELVQEAKASYDKLGTLTMRYTEAKARRETAEKELLLIEEEKMGTAFEGRTMDEAKQLLDETSSVNLEAMDTAAYNRQKYTIPLAALPVAALSAIALTMVTRVPLWPVALLAVMGEAVVGFLFYKKWNAAKAAEAKRTQQFETLKIPNLEALQGELEQYEQLCQKADELRRGFRAADQICEKAMQEMQGLKDGFESAVRTFAPQVADLAEAFSALTEVGKVMDRLGNAEKERETAQSWLETLEVGYEGDPGEAIPQDGLASPLRSKSETNYDLKRMEKELDTLKHSAAVSQGEVRALGDPVVLGARRGALAERQEDLNKQYEALQLAIEVLGEADSEISARFSPILGQKAGYYLGRLTGGAYKRVLFDKNLTPSVERGEESISRDILYLSGGTADQIYLALRLAICDLTFPAEKACPIVLDDALVRFDEERMARALTLLKELGEERQILLFTCHGREASFFRGEEDVNVVTLQ